MAIKLLLHHVLVLPDDITEADATLKRAKAAGIVLELDKREQKAVEFGTVVSVGPTAFKDYGRDNTILNEGDRISFAKYAGKEIQDNDTTYLILNDEDVLAIIS